MKGRIQMTNMENIQHMNLENLAKQNVRHINYMSGYTVGSLFVTSDGYQSSNKDEAIKYELNWLKQDICAE